MQALWLLLLLTTTLHTTSAETVTVYNPEDLQQAVADGARDIILANHLDVSTTSATGFAEFLLDIQPSTRSIRVWFPATPPTPSTPPPPWHDQPHACAPCP